MGIIKRQGIKSTIVNYAGAILGAVAVLFIYPLNDEIYGYAQWLYNISYLLIPIASLGIGSTIVKFFPYFKNKSTGGFNGFLTLIFLAMSIVFGLFLLLWNLFKPYFLILLENMNMDASLLEGNQTYILLLTGLMVLLYFLTSQSTNMLRIVVPNLVQQFGFKLFLPLLVLAYVYFEFSQERFATFIIMFFAAAAVIISIYLFYLNGLKFEKIKRPTPDFKFKSLVSFSLFGSLNQLSSSLAVRIDSIMIPFFLDMLRNGFYNKTLFIANVIEIPARSLLQIAGPIISQAWQEEDYVELNKVYKKASANLFLIGTFVFLGIWLVLDDLIQISSNPENFPDARMIFLLLGAGKLFDMISSVNTHIIIYSKKFKYNLLFLIFLAVSNLVLNFKLIPMYGILGAAIATSISLVVYNLLKLVFIYFNFNLQPFTSSNLKTFALLSAFCLLHYFVPLGFNPIVNMLIKMAVLCLIFLPIAYFWNISEDVNSMISENLKKLKK